MPGIDVSKLTKTTDYGNLVNNILDPSQKKLLLRTLADKDLFDQWNNWDMNKKMDFLNSEDIFGKDQGLFGISALSNDNVNAGLGLGQLALGVASYMDSKKYNDKKLDLLDQQLQNNTELMDMRKRKNKNVSDAFDSVF